jgi:hypothetical protein
MESAAPVAEYIRQLWDSRAEQRTSAAYELARLGMERSVASLEIWASDEEFLRLIVREKTGNSGDDEKPAFTITTGIAVSPETFHKIREANRMPPLADVPPDQDALEFELEFEKEPLPPARLDILTTKAPEGSGAIARYLEKFGEGIQQIEIDVTHVDRATEILRARFKQEPIYPATRAGANGTRVNFFLATDSSQKKVLVELVEKANHKGHS